MAALGATRPLLCVERRGLEHLERPEGAWKQVGAGAREPCGWGRRELRPWEARLGAHSASPAFKTCAWGMSPQTSSSANPGRRLRPQASPRDPNPGGLTRRRWVVSAGRAVTEGSCRAHMSRVLALFLLQGRVMAGLPTRLGWSCPVLLVRIVPASRFLSGSQFETGSCVLLLRLWFCFCGPSLLLGPGFASGPGFYSWGSGLTFGTLVFPPDAVCVWASVLHLDRGFYVRGWGLLCAAVNWFPF